MQECFIQRRVGQGKSGQLINFSGILRLSFAKDIPTDLTDQDITTYDMTRYFKMNKESNFLTVKNTTNSEQYISLYPEPDFKREHLYKTMIIPANGTMKKIEGISGYSSDLFYEQGYYCSIFSLVKDEGANEFYYADISDMSTWETRKESELNNTNVKMNIGDIILEYNTRTWTKVTDDRAFGFYYTNNNNDLIPCLISTRLNGALMHCSYYQNIPDGTQDIAAYLKQNENFHLFDFVYNDNHYYIGIHRGANYSVGYDTMKMYNDYLGQFKNSNIVDEEGNIVQNNEENFWLPGDLIFTLLDDEDTRALILGEEG